MFNLAVDVKIENYSSSEGTRRILLANSFSRDLLEFSSR
jgi:hypothetical protein